MLCERLKLIATWPVAVSEAALSNWLLPLFGHTMYWPPPAEESLCTLKGENVLWPERLSSSTTSELEPEVPEELDELELLELDELEDEEVDDEDEELDEVVEPLHSTPPGLYCP